MIRHILQVVFLLLLLLQSFGLAQTKEIIAEGAYNMGDGETPTVAESRALLQAKRTALEQAGTYVESYSKVKNFQLTEDEIKVLASGLMEVEILDKKRTVVGDGFNFRVKIKARVQTEKMEEMAKSVKEKSVVEDYKKIQEDYDKSLKDIEELKKELAAAKGDNEKKQIKIKITDEERLFQAKEWFAKGYKYGINKEYDEAIEAFTSVIALYPNHAKAYYNRGNAYSKKRQHDRAIEDYDKAIQLYPNHAKAYNSRGIVYAKKGAIGRAISDFQKACDMGNENGCKNLRKALKSK